MKKLFRNRGSEMEEKSGPSIDASRTKRNQKDIYSLPSAVLFFIGCFDVVRGFMHTFNLTWSAANFAKFDMATTPQDQIFLLGVFGISNFLTGFMHLFISRKAKHLSPYILIIIPLAYILGLIGITSGGIRGQAAFEGKYIMMVYFAICIVAFFIFLVQRKKNPSKDFTK